MKNPSQRVIDLLPEIDRLYGPAIRKGFMGRVAIEKEYDVTQAEARHIVAEIQGDGPIEPGTGEILEKGSYDYHESTDVYTLHSNTIGSFDIDGQDIRDIRRSYSNLTGTYDTRRQIASRYPHLSLRQIIEILRLMKITHYSSPYTDEEVVESSTDELVNDLVRQRKIKIAKLYEKQSRQSIEEKARLYELSEIESEERREAMIRELIEFAPEKLDIPLLDFSTLGEREPVRALFKPADIHFGKAAERELTGTDYTLDLCREAVLEATHDVFSRAVKAYDIEEAHVVVANDWFHVDTAGGTTTNGTPQRIAASPLLIMRYGKKLAVEVIQTVLQYAPKVLISGALANHDYLHGAGLVDYLEAYFHNDDRVTIDSSLRTRQYYEYGDVAYGICHGHGVKDTSLPVLMAQEAREIWGRTKWAEIFMGHLHHLKVRDVQAALDVQGVRIYQLPSLSATDNWHEMKGFVKSVRSCELHVFHREKGNRGPFRFDLVSRIRDTFSS